jgi:hypothetical protein
MEVYLVSSVEEKVEKLQEHNERPVIDITKVPKTLQFLFEPNSWMLKAAMDIVETIAHGEKTKKPFNVRDWKELHTTNGKAQSTSYNAYRRLMEFGYIERQKGGFVVFSQNYVKQVQDEQKKLLLNGSE